MTRRQQIGALWIAIAALSFGVTVIFRVDVTQIVVTIGLGAATAGLGGWLLAGRAIGGAIPTSIATGVVWLVVYGALAILQRDELAAWVTDVFLAVAGSGVGLLAWTSQRGEALAGERRGGDARPGE